MPPTIQNRDQIEQTLHLASHLEHGLSLLYMFAAFSLRKNPSDYPDYDTVPSSRRQEYDLAMNAVRLWEKDILLVSRQEMEHLAIDMNLLNAIGREPYLNRPNFPISADAHAINIPFHLVRFEELTLQRFREFEKPNNITPVPPINISHRDCRPPTPIPPDKCECHFFSPSYQEYDPLGFANVQDLYQALGTAYTTLPPGEVFVGDSKYQVESSPVNFEGKVYVKPVYNRDTAKTAIDFVLEQGEGIQVHPVVPPLETSHYDRFTEIYQEFVDFQIAHPGIEVALPVICNPAVAYPTLPVHPFANQVTAEPAASLMKLFDEGYYLMVVLLKAWFAGYQGFFGNFPSFNYARINQTLYQSAFFPFMTMFIRPLGELLMRLPAGSAYPGKTAGPGFQLVPDSLGGTVNLPIDKDLQWYLDRFTSLINKVSAAQLLAPNSPYINGGEYQSQLTYLKENLSRMQLNFSNDWNPGDIVQ